MRSASCKHSRRKRDLTDDIGNLIQEQIRYYRARAPEYDATTTPVYDRLAPQEDRLRAALDDFRPDGRVLEVACGTGQWTERLLDHASEVVAVDAATEMIELNRRRVAGGARVRYVEADIFSWVPDRDFDVVFFANWLSHVPLQRFDAFWDLVREALAPGGRVFFIDEAKDAWRHEESLNEEIEQHPTVPIVRRSLRDRRSYRVVKIFWDPEELEERLRERAWDITVDGTGAFYWGRGRPLS